MARDQKHFLDVVNRHIAERCWRVALRPEVLEAQEVERPAAVEGMLAVDVVAGGEEFRT